MKKFLFYYSQLNTGGAEKSLSRLMNALVEEGEDVTLLCRCGNGNGEYMLDKRVKKLCLSSYSPKKGCHISTLVNNAICLLQRLWMFFKLKMSSEEYDITFVGLQGLSPDYILRNIKTRKIAIFIRNDVSVMKERDRVLAILRKHVNRVDYYICVAETVKRSLIKEIPETDSKTMVIYNILNMDEMKHNLDIAEAPFINENKDIFRIVSVCRMVDKAKGLYRMLNICKRLKDEGLQFRWYIVGDGYDLDAFRKTISENGLDGIMITPGRLNNPFGYYRDCNLVAMLSYYEGLCGVVNEAKVAGKAIIATEVSGIREQLKHGINGWIVENDEAKIIEGIRYLLSHPEVIKSMSNHNYPEAILNDRLKLNEIENLVS